MPPAPAPGARVPLPAVPSVPIPSLVSNVFSRFPLVTYPAPPTTSGAPTSPTLWLLGPPPASGVESLDPRCRQAQALARFCATPLTPRWLPSALSAPGGVLPALHLPNGALLSAPEVPDHFLATPGKDKDKGAASPSAAAASSDAKHSAFLSLLNTTLLPAVLAAVYLAPPSASLTVVPPRQLPLLSAWAASWAGVSERRERINEILKLRGKKVGIRAVLDLEEVEREGVETIGALEDVAGGHGSDLWFGGAA
ncbi:hypothetical protein RQP46_004101 [Phenoliferia psychrophenolica]